MRENVEKHQYSGALSIMFKNAFANLQKVGKSLMLPVSVLPIAGILLGVGSANFSWLPAVVSHVMAEAGGSVFANMPLIFAIGVALASPITMAFRRWPLLLPMASWSKPWLWLRRWFCTYPLKKLPQNTWQILVFLGDYFRCDCSVHVQSFLPYQVA